MRRCLALNIDLRLGYIWSMSHWTKLRRSWVLKFPYRFKFLIRVYHFLLVFLGALVYGFPGRALYVIGVTGTKGKTTTCNLIAQVLNSAGFKTGAATTVNFVIGDREWVNDTKQTMLGRLALQKLLAQMRKEGCRYAVIETSSEGILQFRHKFLFYRMAIFTNLSPEHVERHGGFDKYREAKFKLFASVTKRRGGIGVYNLDDENVDYFLSAPISKKFGFTLKKRDFPVRQYFVDNVKLSPEKTSFNFADISFEAPLTGEFNLYNLAAAVSAALALGVSTNSIQACLKIVRPPEGRMEIISRDPFFVVVDYSYEPKGLDEALKAVQLFRPKRLITLIGSAGGGRDKWRRPVMGEVAALYSDLVVVSTDDPYDEDPGEIVDEVLAGALKNKKMALGKNVFRILDRRDGIKQAISLAEPGDLVFLTGKGGERWMNIVGGGKIPWSDSEIAREILAKK